MAKRTVRDVIDLQGRSVNPKPEAKVGAKQNKRLTIGQHFTACGVSSAHLIAAAIKLLWLHKSGILMKHGSGKLNPTIEEAEDLYLTHGDALHEGVHQTRALNQLYGNGSVPLATYVLIHKQDACNADRYFRVLATGRHEEGVPEAVYQLREILENNARSYRRLHRHDLFNLYLVAWQGGDLSKIKCRAEATHHRRRWPDAADGRPKIESALSGSRYGFPVVGSKIESAPVQIERKSERASESKPLVVGRIAPAPSYGALLRRDARRVKSRFAPLARLALRSLPYLAMLAAGIGVALLADHFGLIP